MVPEQILALLTVIANLQIQYEQMRNRYEAVLEEKNKEIQTLQAEKLAKEIEDMEKNSSSS